ncbi:hypothetical protein QBC34DRAFT_202384 [Podospora aff. communis PSN243]|uniref:Uncharacterized protein n=1 Tax=Podospora aff. communis PSN243 TaxID=3040156 RepID=A0AAV9G5X8_9PEZI|nr:hypothetical protein QBC34DRAFT_202384 [Podospora aff. communis PSN243]
MKFLSTILLIGTPLAFALPNPNPNPEPVLEATTPANPLEARDNYCWLNNEAYPSQPLGCDHDRWNGQRKRGVYAADRFGVSCTTQGRTVTWPFPSGSQTSSKWGYVPGWDCWIWYPFTQQGCDAGLPQC